MWFSYVICHNSICGLGQGSVINPLPIYVLLLYPLKTENRRFSDVFSGYSRGTLVENGSMTFWNFGSRCQFQGLLIVIYEVLFFIYLIFNWNNLLHILYLLHLHFQSMSWRLFGAKTKVHINCFELQWTSWYISTKIWIDYIEWANAWKFVLLNNRNSEFKVFLTRKCSEIWIYIVPFFADFWLESNWFEIYNMMGLFMV